MLRSQTAGIFTVEQMEDRCLLSAYTLTDLGGPLLIHANDINEAGQVVGSATTAAGQPHAFLWDDGVMTDLGTLGGPTSSAGGLNDAGQVVGGSRVSARKLHNRRLPLGERCDDRPWHPEAGRGWRDQRRGSDRRRLHPATPCRPARRPSGGLSSGTTACFETCSPASPPTSMTPAWWPGRGKAPGTTPWPPSGTPRTARARLGVLPGGVFSAAYGLNDVGQVVGWSESFNGNHAFLWDDGQMIDLGCGTVAADINNAGPIVGWSNIWIDGVRADLNDLVPEGFGLTIWSCERDQRRRTDRRHCLDAQSVPHAVLLNPLPEDTPLISIGDATVTEGHTGTRTAAFTVTLSTASDRAGHGRLRHRQRHRHGRQRLPGRVRARSPSPPARRPRRSRCRSTATGSASRTRRSWST